MTDSPHVHVCRAPADAVDGGRVADANCSISAQEVAVDIVSPSTLPAAEFDLTHPDSDLETVGDEEERPQERGNTLRFEPWVGGMAPLPARPPPSMFVEEVPVDVQGDIETDSVGSVNIPNKIV